MTLLERRVYQRECYRMVFIGEECLLEREFIGERRLFDRTICEEESLLEMNVF